MNTTANKNTVKVGDQVEVGLDWMPATVRSVDEAAGTFRADVFSGSCIFSLDHSSGQRWRRAEGR